MLPATTATRNALNQRLIREFPSIPVGSTKQHAIDIDYDYRLAIKKYLKRFAYINLFCTFKGLSLSFEFSSSKIVKITS